MQALSKRNTLLRELQWHQIRHENEVCLLARVVTYTQQILQVQHNFNYK